MVRPNELSFARRGALNKLAARRQGARPSQLTAVFVGVDPEDDSRVIVSFDGSEVSVLAGPVKMVPGALCAVEVDSANAPVRVLGPVTTRPEGLDEDAEAPVPVTAMPELAPHEGMTDEQLGRLQDTADNLAQAQTDLALKADSSALAALAGVVEDLDIPDISGLASKAEMDAAAQAAEDAAKEHADLVSAGASADAIAAAAADAQSKADAAEAAAKAHADDRYDVLKDFADDLQVVADQAAVDAAAAQAKANAAVADTKIEYAVSTSQTTPPSSGWSTSTPTRAPGSYVWMRTTITYGDGTPSVLAPVLVTGNDGAKGDQGDQGSTGVSVTSVTPFYRQAATQPAKPSGMTPDGWATTEPAYAEDTSVWRSDRIVFSNGQIAWTDVSKSSSYELAKAAKAAAEAAQADATAAHLLALDGEVALDRLTSGKLKPTVVEALIADLAIIDYLEATDAWVGGSMMKDGAVTSRTLNVVPEEGTGGMELLPPGLRIIPSDAEAGTAVSLRTDEDTWIRFAQGGESTFSVTPDGHLVAQRVDANESLTYRSVELQESLDQKDSGIIAMARNTAPISIGSSEGRLLAVSFQAPSDNRMVEIKVMGRVATSARRRATIRLKQSATGVVTPLNSTQKTWYLQTDWAESFERSVTRSVSEWGWIPGDTVTVGVFIESLTEGEALSFPAAGDQEIIVKDAGPWLAIQGHAPWAPTTGGGGGGGNETAPTPRAYTLKRASTWTRSFLGNNNHYNYGAGRAYQGLQPGTSNGNLKSMIGFGSLASVLDGATVDSIKLKLKNNHTWSHSGGTAYIGLHGHETAPSTFGLSAGNILAVPYSPGQTKTITIPSSYHAKFINGDYTGIVLYTGTSSLSRYGYWDGANAELIVEYEK